jgi:hypothetical protein
MKSNAAEALLNQIDQAIRDIQGFTAKSPLEESYLAKFLVVFICGIYEESVEAVINEKIAKLNSTQASQFVAKSLKYFRNPNMGNIKELLGKFDILWAQEVDRVSAQAKAAIDSIVINKNSLAHGTPCHVTLIEIIRYYNDSRAVIEKIDDFVL